MANIPNKPAVTLQEWIDEQTPLDHNNLTGGINGNLSTLKAAVDGLIDALGGAGSKPPEGIFYITGELIPESPDDPVRINLTNAEHEKILDDRTNQIIAYDDMANRVYFFNKQTHSIDENDVYFVCGNYYAYVEGKTLTFGEKRQSADTLELTLSGTNIYIKPYPETAISLTQSQLQSIYQGINKIKLTVTDSRFSNHDRIYWLTKTDYDPSAERYYYSCRAQEADGDVGDSEYGRRDVEFTAHVKRGVPTLFMSRASRLYKHSIFFNGTTHVRYIYILTGDPDPCDFEGGYDAQWLDIYVEAVASVDDVLKQISSMYIETGSIHLLDTSGNSISDTYTSYTEDIACV